MRDSREKGAGMRDQDPPFQTLLVYTNKIYKCLLACLMTMDLQDCCVVTKLD